MARSRTRFISATLTSILAIAALGPSASAQGNQSYPIVADACVHDRAWQASVNPSSLPSEKSARWVRGTFDYCLTVYRLPDESATYNWYLGELWVQWTPTGGGHSWGDNRAWGTLTVSHDAVNDSYKATPSVKGEESCGITVSIGYSWNGFGVSTPIKLCSGTWLNREGQNDHWAKWGVDDLVNARMWTQLYQTKQLASDGRPAFTGTIYYPVYSVYTNYDTGRLEYTKVYSSVTFRL